MADEKVTRILDRLGRMKADRAVWEPVWQELAQYVRPMRAEFQGARPAERKRTEKLFDGTAPAAAEMLAAGLWGMAVNGAADWFAIVHPEPALMRIRDVAIWYQIATNRMQQVFAANGGLFYAQMMEALNDLVTFGTDVFFVDEAPARNGLVFKTRHLTECYVAENAGGVVDTCYREFTLTARQAAQQFGERALSDRTRKLLNPSGGASAARPDELVTFVHAVEPQDEYEPDRPLTPRGKPVSSCYVEPEAGHLVREGGMWHMPFKVARWSQASRSVWGDGPALRALPDIKMLNAMGKTTIVAAQKAADPPILAPDEGTIRGLRTSPGQPIYGAVDGQGRPLVHPFITGANFNLTMQLEKERREAVREAFYWSLMIMISRTNMTATEVLERNEEKLRQLGPYIARVSNEQLEPVIVSTFQILARADAFPPMPPALAEWPAASVEYLSPMMRAQQAYQASGTIRAVQAVGTLAAVDPEVIDIIDGDEAARSVADGLGAPATIIRDPRQVAARRQQRAQMQQAALLADKAPQVASAIKDVAQANQIAQQPPAPAQQGAA